MDADLGGFAPFNDAHAIFACTLSLLFASPSPTARATWNNDLRAAGKSFANVSGFGAPRPSYGMNMIFDQTRLLFGIDRPVSSISEVVGFDLHRFSEESELVDRITIAAEQLTVHTLAYIRWQPFVERWRELIKHTASLYEGQPVAGLRLEYWDRFDCKGSTGDLSKLFRRDNNWVARGSVSRDMAWGCTNIINSLELDGIRRVLQVRLDASGFPTNGQARRTILMQTVVHDHFASASSTADALRSDWMPYARAEAQHDLLKSVLGEVISDAAIERIALKA